jgi:cellulose 1,4-beta-cellobiosidase
MLWLDSTYPVDSTSAGAQRGPCSTSSGVPSELESSVPNSSVSFSNIKFGPIGTTYSSDGSDDGGDDGGDDDGDDTPVAKYGQCGGANWTGSTTCVSGSTCTKVNDYYSQCL